MDTNAQFLPVETFSRKLPCWLLPPWPQSLLPHRRMSAMTARRASCGTCHHRPINANGPARVGRTEGQISPDNRCKKWSDATTNKKAGPCVAQALDLPTIQGSPHEQQPFVIRARCEPRATAQAGRVFMMREWLGFETPKICERLCLTSDNCRMILHRARTGLRQCMTSHGHSVRSVA